MIRPGAATAVTPVDAAAFGEFLELLSLSVRRRISGVGGIDALAAELIQMRAGAAAYRAFPMGSPESRALGVLLAAALRVTAEVTT